MHLRARGHDRDGSKNNSVQARRKRSPTGSARTENGVPVTTDRGDLFVIAGDVVNPLPKGAAVGITLADHGVTLVGV